MVKKTRDFLAQGHIREEYLEKSAMIMLVG
jgi:hypothetical protein